MKWLLNLLSWRTDRKNEMHTNETIKSIIDKNYFVADGPNYVAIDITNRCNLNCIACWSYSPLLSKMKPQPSWHFHELSLSAIEKLIDDLARMGTEKIRLSGGGDPFMHPQLMQICKKIKESGLILEISTNFTLVSNKKISELLKLGINNITISLWAATPETYSITHPNQDEKTFERLVENLIFLNEIKKNTKVVIANVISNKNYFEVEKMARLGKMVNADEIYFTMADTIKNATDRLLLDEAELHELKRIWSETIMNMNKGMYGKLIIDNPSNFSKKLDIGKCTKGMYEINIAEIPCTAGYSFTRILANGDVAPCCRAVMMPSGNINRESFREIWNGRKQQLFRKIGLEIYKHPHFMDKVGCKNACDNHMQNVEMHEMIKRQVR